MLVIIFCTLLAWGSVFPAFMIQEQKKPADQDQAVQLRTELVEVRAVVTDKEGRPVGGLKKEDFEIIEKGRSQEIGFFSEHRIEAPGGRITAQPGTPGPQDRPAPGESETVRSIILVVDTLNLSGESLLRVKQSLKRFVVEHVTDRDAVMIVASGGTDAFSAHFMRDRWMLRYAIDRLQYWGSMRSSYFTPTLAADVKREDVEAIRLAQAILASEGLPADRRMADFWASEVLAEAEFRRRGLLNTVKFAAETLVRAPGQRLLLLISDGFSLLDRRGDQHAPELQPVISKAARSGVVIYSVNAKGLAPAAGFDPALRGVTGDARTFGSLSRYMSAWEKDALEGMNALAKDTGGETFFRTNDMLGALRQSVDDNRVYYAMAYYPSDPGDKESFRPVSVRVKGHPQYNVRTLKGYLASDLLPPKEEKALSPQQRLFNALAEPIASPAIPISASASYLEVGTDQASVSFQLRIDGSEAGHQQENGEGSLDIELAAAVYDRSGTLVNSYTERVQATLTAEEFAAARASGYQYAKRLELKPGLYQVRAGVRDSKTERIGTTIAWVEVPNLTKKGLTLSGILLSEGEEVKNAQRPGPARWRPIKTYNSDGTLVYYLRAYNIPASGEAETFIQSEIYQGDETVFRSDWQPLSARIHGRDRKGIDIGGRMSLSLRPGLYELKISVRDSRMKQATTQTVMFLIED